MPFSHQGSNNSCTEHTVAMVFLSLCPNVLFETCVTLFCSFIITYLQLLTLLMHLSTLCFVNIFSHYILIIVSWRNMVNMINLTPNETKTNCEPKNLWYSFKLWQLFWCKVVSLCKGFISKSHVLSSGCTLPMPKTTFASHLQFFAFHHCGQVV